MTPSAVGSLAPPARAAVPVVNAGTKGRYLDRKAAGRGQRPAKMTYTPVVSPPVLASQDELDVADEEILVPPSIGGVAAARLPVLREVDEAEADPLAALPGPPAGADDPIAPGSSVTLFEQAVEENSRRLLAIARAIVGYRASPEDVVQQAVMNLYKHRARYDWRKPGGLLKRATVNEALRLLRPPRMTMVADDHPAAFRAPSSDMETNETVRKVREAIDQLPDHFRAALVLCEYEGMSYAQIAETLDASIPQIKTWLHRARRKLATILEPFVEEQNQELRR